MLKIWIRTFGKEFYRQHAGLLLVMFYVLFGWMQSGDILAHLNIVLLAICSSPVATGIFCLCFFLYGLKTLNFVHQKVSVATYSFVMLSCAAKPKDQMRNWLGLYCILLLPFLLFTLSLLITSIYYHYFWCLLTLTISSTVLFSGLVLYTFKKLNCGFKQSITLSVPRLAVKKPYWTWSIFYILEQQTLMLIICKILSFVVFTGTLWLFSDSGNDIRVYLIAMLAAIVAHSILLAAVWRFVKSSLIFLNSLPISGWSRLLSLILFLLILFCPELIVYSIRTSFSPYSMVTGILFALSSLLSLYLAIYLLGDHGDRYLKFVCLFFLTAIFTILSRQYLALSLLLITLNLGYHYHLFYKNKL